MFWKNILSRDVRNISLRALIIIILGELVIASIGSTFAHILPALNNVLLHSALVALAVTPLLVWFVIIPVVNQRKEELERTQNLALHDPLTGLPNRLLLSEYLDRCLSGNPRYKFVGALLYFDLDGFKAVNDNYGHEAGDTVLMTIGHRLKDAFRTEDIVSRVGGDEFVLLVQNLGDNGPKAKQDIFQIAQKVQALIAVPIELMGHRFTIDCSVGICMLDNKRISPALALRKADLAMYKSKQQSPHKIIFADELELRSYGISTTCVPEIDQEHIEIDALLKEAIVAEGNQEVYMDRIIDAIKRHLRSEEKISREKSLNMTDAHLARHKQLRKQLSILRIPACNTPFEEVFKTLQDILQDHVVTFDRELTIRTEETDAK